MTIHPDREKALLADDGFKRDVAVFKGWPPHDGPTNYCRGDGYFFVSLKEKHSLSEDELNGLIRRLENRRGRR